jgi:uncharacterized membrane protein (UPF0136 family)
MRHFPHPEMSFYCHETNAFLLGMACSLEIYSIVTGLITYYRRRSSRELLVLLSGITLLTANLFYRDLLFKPVMDRKSRTWASTCLFSAIYFLSVSAGKRYLKVYSKHTRRIGSLILNFVLAAMLLYIWSYSIREINRGLIPRREPILFIVLIPLTHLFWGCFIYTKQVKEIMADNSIGLVIAAIQASRTLMIVLLWVVWVVLVGTRTTDPYKEMFITSLMLFVENQVVSNKTTQSEGSE